MRRCKDAQTSVAWPSGVSVADFRSDIIKCRLSGCLFPACPDLAILAATSGLVATATLEQLQGWGWGGRAVSYRYCCSTQSELCRRWALECGADQVWRRVMFVCRRPDVRFYSYLDWPIRFWPTVDVVVVDVAAATRRASVPKWHSFALQGNCTWMCPVWGLMLSMWAWPASYSGKRRWQICQKNESSMSCRMPALTSSSHSTAVPPPVPSPLYATFSARPRHALVHFGLPSRRPNDRKLC